MSDINPPISEKTPVSGKQALAARLLAVQACYEILHGSKKFPGVIRYYVDNRHDLNSDGALVGKADLNLFLLIMRSLEERFIDIEEILKAHIKQPLPSDEPAVIRDIELLLKAVLYCGIVELLIHTQIDSPIIINDYLDITHGFYEKQQVSLVNGILDSVASIVRH